MRVLAVFRKALREQTRDVLLLVLSLIFAPVFVLLYRVWFPSGSTTYDVLVLNQDAGAPLSDGAIAALEAVTYPNGSPLLQVRPVSGRAAAEGLLRDRDADALLIIPPGFSAGLAAARDGGQGQAGHVTLVGDLTNPYYAVAAVMASAAVEGYVATATGRPPLIGLDEQPLGASAARTEFENYVPGLLVFATMMLMFTTAMTLVREAESRTLRRLQITRMSAFDLLAGTSAALVLIGVLDVVLTFATAWGLGFRSEGPVWVAVLAGAVTSVAVVGVGLVVAAFSRTVTQAFLVANFPLALFMFFSGAVFPIPRVPLFAVGQRTFGLYDILPPTHAVAALNKVLTMGAGLGDVTYELAALAVLSAAYFAAGVWLFRRRHLRPE